MNSSQNLEAKALFLTVSGKFVDLFHLTRDDITIRDIAHGLSNCCRYNGQVKKFYSVAQHCVLLANYAEKHGSLELAKYLLMHDASEAYIGDVVYHLKAHMPEFVELENKILAEVFAKFGVDDSLSIKDTAHKLDRQICFDEMKTLMKHKDPNFIKDGIVGLNIHVYPWSPYISKVEFLATYKRLFNIK